MRKTPKPLKYIALAVVVGLLTGAATIFVDGDSVAEAWAAEDEKDGKKAEDIDSERRKQIVDIMDHVFKVLNTIMSMEGLSDSEKRDRAIDYLRTFRYGKDNKGYIKVVSLDGVIQVEPNIIEMVGKDLHGFEDPNVFRVFEEFIRICYEQGEGWSTYVWPTWGGKEQHVPTVSLVRFFGPLNFAIVLAYNPETITIDDVPPPYIDDHQTASPI